MGNSTTKVYSPNKRSENGKAQQPEEDTGGKQSLVSRKLKKVIHGTVSPPLLKKEGGKVIGRGSTLHHNKVNHKRTTLGEGAYKRAKQIEEGLIPVIPIPHIRILKKKTAKQINRSHSRLSLHEWQNTLRSSVSEFASVQSSSREAPPLLEAKGLPDIHVQEALERLKNSIIPSL